MFKNTLLMAVLLIATQVLAEFSYQATIRFTSVDKELLLNAEFEKAFTLQGFSDKLKFKRIDIYSSSSIVKLFSENGNSTLSNSGRLFFTSINTAEKVALSYDPKSHNIHADIHQKNKKFHMQGVLSDLSNNKLASLKIHESSDQMEFDCLNDLYDRSEIELTNLPALNPQIIQNIDHSAANSRLGGNPSFQAAISVDTDNELMWNKFSNNTNNATSWIEDLFLNMNLIYESELDIRMQIRSVFLRVDHTPVNNPDFNADPATFNNGLTPF